MFSLKTPFLRHSISVMSASIPKRSVSVFGYTQAKALVFSEFGPPKDVLRLHSHSISPAYGEEITVRFLASPINPSDINQIEGFYPIKPEFTTALGTPNPIAVPGNEGVVEVISTGASVQDFAKGDRAIMRTLSFGTWRTHASTTSANLLKIPSPNITPLQAATVSVNPCTAYRMLKDFADLGPGDWFLQNAANSGVGRAAIQFAKIWGMKSMNIVRAREGVEELKKELRELGADEVVTDEEISREDVREDLKSKVGGGGVKLGFNCVGGKQVIDLCKLLRTGGHLVTYGAMSKKPFSLGAGHFVFQDLHLHGFWAAAWMQSHPETKKLMLDEIFGYMESGKLKDVPFDIAPWKWDTKVEELKAAVDRSGQGFHGKKTVFVFEE